MTKGDLSAVLVQGCDRVWMCRQPIGVLDGSVFRLGAGIGNQRSAVTKSILENGGVLVDRDAKATACTHILYLNEECISKAKTKSEDAIMSVTVEWLMQTIANQPRRTYSCWLPAVLHTLCDAYLVKNSHSTLGTCVFEVLQAC